MHDEGKCDVTQCVVAEAPKPTMHLFAWSYHLRKHEHADPQIKQQHRSASQGQDVINNVRRRRNPSTPHHSEQEYSVTLHNQIMSSCVPEAEVAVLAAAAAVAAAAQPGALSSTL